MINIYTDGGSRGNPGASAIGGVLLRDGEVLAEISEYIGIQTNNYSEYKALEVTLQKAISLGIKEAVVYLDSKLVVEQVNGRWKINNEELLKLCKSILLTLIPQFDYLNIVHVRRELNKKADQLVNKALDQLKKKF